MHALNMTYFMRMHSTAGEGAVLTLTLGGKLFSGKTVSGVAADPPFTGVCQVMALSDGKFRGTGSMFHNVRALALGSCSWHMLCRSSVAPCVVCVVWFVCLFVVGGLSNLHRWQ